MGILGTGSLLHRVEEEVLSVLFHRRAYLRGNGRCSPRSVSSGGEAAIWDEKSIDTSLFIDDDGTPYLYFVRFTDGNVIWVAEMNDDLTGIKQETLTECIKVGEPWELSQDKPARVAEGPSVLKKEGVYYLVYSANHFESKNYGVATPLRTARWDRGRNTRETLFCNVPTA